MPIDLPCTGFAMGDMVIRNFIEETSHAAILMESWLVDHTLEVYVMIADEQQRPQALAIIQQLRLQVFASITSSKVKFNKQFKSRRGPRPFVYYRPRVPRGKTQDLGHAHRRDIPSR